MASFCSHCGTTGDGRKIQWIGPLRQRRCGARNPSDNLSLDNCRLRMERQRQADRDALRTPSAAVQLDLDHARAYLARFASPPAPAPAPAPTPPPPPIRMVIPGPARIREMNTVAERFENTRTVAGTAMEILDDYKERMPEQCYLELANQMKKMYDSSLPNF